MNFRSSDWLRRLALASLATNIVIVVTGGAVRLTGSGLGCPTWPRCTDASYVASAELGIHGAIEYGNRMLTGVVGVIAAACLVSALLQRPRRRRPVVGSILVLIGVAAQAIIGGITVRTQLNPDVVGTHFLISMGLIAAAYWVWVATREPDGPAIPTVPGPLRALSGLLVAASLAVLVVGTLVTGSGPHAGDAKAQRNGLDPGLLAQFHADLVFLVLGLAIAAWFGFRATSSTAAAVRTAWLLGIVAAQGLIGFVQYATHLPEILVGAHIAGACAVWVATLSVLHSTRTRLTPASRILDGGGSPGSTNHPRSGHRDVVRQP